MLAIKILSKTIHFSLPSVKTVSELYLLKVNIRAHSFSFILDLKLKTTDSLDKCAAWMLNSVASKCLKCKVFNPNPQKVLLRRMYIQ